ncbi:MAG: hypothetical protein KF855_08415 [Acidobacteria bacterium]|nr:hypothetical protein [Acidobacteriota bacterium]
MQETLTNGLPKLSKTKMAAYERELDALLKRLRESNLAAKQTYKEIDRLRKSNDRSFERMKRAVEKLESY